jgi:hypothetical protein
MKQNKSSQNIRKETIAQSIQSPKNMGKRGTGFLRKVLEVKKDDMNSSSIYPIFHKVAFFNKIIQ